MNIIYKFCDIVFAVLIISNAAWLTSVTLTAIKFYILPDFAGILSTRSVAFVSFSTKIMIQKLLLIYYIAYKIVKKSMPG